MELLKVILANFRDSLLFRPGSLEESGCYFIKPMSLANAWSSMLLFRKVFPDKSYGALKFVFLAVVARRFSVCALNEKDEVVAFEFFRLSSQDLRDGTVHESFIGVHPLHAGRGLATCLRKFSAISLKENGYKGISSRISLSNYGSLKSAEKLGFELVNSYPDSDGQCEGYFILKFDKHD